jgi:hypothetical protein
MRSKSIRLAEKWTIEHMKGEGGIGAIFPAMANAVMALKVLGYPEDHPDARNRPPPVVSPGRPADTGTGHRRDGVRSSAAAGGA